MATKQSDDKILDTELLGRDVSFNYSGTWLGYSLLSLRIVMAWVFLQAGLEKWSEGGWGDPVVWSSRGFLENAVPGSNPLHGLFMWFADFAAVVDPLVVTGQVLIGIALLFGVLVRFAALMGGIQMLFFWTAAWQDGLMAGLPVEHGYVVDSTFVYLLLLFGLGAWGAGRVVGLDSIIEEIGIVQNNRWLRYLLG
ncbi:DoxX family protein [Halovenus rubra]|uniref:DoxX family protein n=2 Tax=Halovenus rubra TaxID=869890 RepID=A0ACC7DXB5_9EURY|nr:DoxX family protein [Halovenus rubra]